MDQSINDQSINQSINQYRPVRVQENLLHTDHNVYESWS